jgi:hypothetical protein
MAEVGRDTEKRSGPHTRDLVEKTMKMVGSRGVNVVNVSEAERRAWAEMLAESPSRIGKRFEGETKLPVRKIMKAYMDATEAAGHKWAVKYNLD